MSKNEFYRCRLERYIPWGSSTCSKRANLIPEEPSVVVRGKGCRIWDADGREFIDFRNALGPISLGYCYEEVNAAIRAQLEEGIIFSYPHPLEAELAELLCEIVPCAEQSRFLKTGGEAIAACIKVARAKSGRNQVIQIGYNGWLNSLAGEGVSLPNHRNSSLPPGVPAVLSALHHDCPWNDPEALESLGRGCGDDLAAVVVAVDYHRMEEGDTFYPLLRKFADQHGAALIFDEIVSGFRIALAGVQEYFAVKPDMAVFAKGLANGMPLAAYCGLRQWMEALDTAIVSSTYGGEALSLAAAKAVIRIYRSEPVIEHLWKMSELMWSNVNRMLSAKGLPLQLSSTRPVAFLRVENNAALAQRQDFLRACFREGVSLYNGGYINYSHREADIYEALERIDKALQSI
ncbi:MAG: aminotransferase class III-fold pyridoxal phosphate-dependent enzyme, partial [Lentisphaeria bacterium]|nr:aminotransferase class III-fold pyridoxal phosphate-dependent enzyme [Lentisphaeria bacterium]NLZ59866.1 aminotransferase class III-fold pyridoxal phosphate-dependent enzyme [Lentisphaerota bacterium]